MRPNEDLARTHSAQVLRQLEPLPVGIVERLYRGANTRRQRDVTILESKRSPVPRLEAFGKGALRQLLHLEQHVAGGFFVHVLERSAAHHVLRAVVLEQVN